MREFYCPNCKFECVIEEIGTKLSTCECHKCGWVMLPKKPIIHSVDFRIRTELLNDGKGRVSIQDAYFDKEGIDAPFEFWMMACEYLLHKTCQKSPAGYERAMELLNKGAMTYKNINPRDIPINP